MCANKMREIVKCERIMSQNNIVFAHISHSHQVKYKRWRNMINYVKEKKWSEMR